MFAIYASTFCHNERGNIMSDNNQTLGRREFLLASGVAALATVPTAVAASDLKGAAQPKLVETALDCVATGSACLNHCVNDMRSGSLTLVECLAQVRELVAACDALAKLASYGSAHLPRFAAATAEVCKSCEAECRKHEDHHEPCGACADDCVKCAEACAQYLKTV
jgi:Cys-rich four helix bundle protein (predicted Tat secretion target)